MAKARRISAFIRKVLLADSRARITYDPCVDRMWIYFSDAIVKDDMCCDNKDLVVSSKFMGTGVFAVVFNCETMGEEPDKKRGQFSFDNVQHVRDRRAVTEQEEDGADMIGGRRHVGSGAIDGLKSDASSDKWQQETKQTRRQSFGVKLSVLDKITREARAVDKAPMVYLRFTEPEQGIVAEDDWVIIPKSVFRKMEGAGYVGRDLPE